METFEFKVSDGEKLFVRRSRAVRERSVAVFIAGVESHGGWYEETLGALSESGTTAYFLDRRGSGKSSGLRGDLPSLRRLILDLEEFTDLCKSGHAGKPIDLFAISWGAKWAIHFWRKVSGNSYRKLILITPGLYRKVDLPFSLKVGAVFSVLAAPQKTFPIPILTESFTRSPERLRFLQEDPDRLHGITARFLKVNAELDLSLRRYSGIYPQPVVVFQAGKDLIVDNERSLTFLKQHFFDVRPTQYPEAFHTLEFEEKIPYGRDLVMSVLTD